MLAYTPTNIPCMPARLVLTFPPLNPVLPHSFSVRIRKAVERARQSLVGKDPGGGEAGGGAARVPGQTGGSLEEPGGAGASDAAEGLGPRHKCAGSQEAALSTRRSAFGHASRAGAKATRDVMGRRTQL